MTTARGTHFIEDRQESQSVDKTRRPMGRPEEPVPMPTPTPRSSLAYPMAEGYAQALRRMHAISAKALHSECYPTACDCTELGEQIRC